MPNHKRKGNFGDGNDAKRISVKREKSPGLDFINMLNDNCLAEIFMHLPIKDRFILKKVCRRWKGSPQLIWSDLKNLHFEKPDNDLLSKDERFWERIFKEIGSFVRNLKFEGLSGIIMPPVGKYCQNLTRLEIEMPVGTVIYDKWFPQMEQLEYLKMTASKWDFYDHFWETLPHESLTELHLFVHRPTHDFHAEVSDEAAIIFEKLTKLSALTLNGFSLKSDMIVAINRRINLTYLNLRDCSMKDDLPHLGLLIHLEHLDLSNVIQINNNVVCQITETCKKLKVLNLEGCARLTDNGIKNLHKLPHLEELNLTFLGRITDYPISKLSNLKKLQCDFAKNVKDDGILKLMRCAHNLEQLSVSDGGASWRVVQLAFELRKQLNRNI